ncbi:MAG: hypothetical protein MK081_05380 [Flavobacteriales bacterium]|nr:hypothetical protein [Flavobacteriales bacterium]
MDVRAIIENYEGYFRSTPEAAGNSYFWNSLEVDLYEDFDFSRASLFQGDMNAELLFRHFSPFVLSVEPLGEKYQIRVLYSSNTSDPEYIGSKVWCIHKLNAVKENNRWVFENLIVELTKQWSSQSYGLIHYFHPENHVFNHQEAKQALAFCEDFIERFDPQGVEPFNYFITNSIDDMGLLENFDYYFVGVTGGKAREGMILTAKGNEFYPHELVHQLLPMNKNRGYLIEEGLAVFLGTREDMNEFEQLMGMLATDLVRDPLRFNFETLISQTTQYNGYRTAYPSGAAICELIYQLKGDQGLQKLMNACTSDYTSLMNSLTTILGMNHVEVTEAWSAVVNSYNKD